MTHQANIAATHKIIWIPVAIGLALGSVSTKFAGAAWAWLLMAGLVSLWQTRALAIKSPHPSIPHALARTWVIFTACALLLKIIPLLYWGDPWSERHAELRLFLGAIALFGLTRLTAPNAQALKYLVLAAAIYCTAGLYLMWVLGRISAPTNPIPWAAGVALVSCWLLGAGFMNRLPAKPWLWICALSSAIGLLTVLTSETRGAYGLLIVLPLMAWLLWRQQNRQGAFQRNRRKSLAILISCTVLVFAFVWAFKSTPVVQRPLQALTVTVEQLQGSQSSLTSNYNSSVGARLYLWIRSAQASLESPWIGYGHDQRKQLLQTWAADTQLAEPIVFGHVHSDYFHTLIDHGLWGLASFLCYAAGLLVLSLKLLQRQLHAPAMVLLGMLLMHMSTALSNVNFAHNYYPTMLSLMVSLTLWFTASETTKAP
jgi:O-antigen ligase